MQHAFDENFAELAEPRVGMDVCAEFLLDRLKDDFAHCSAVVEFVVNLDIVCFMLRRELTMLDQRTHVPSPEIFPKFLPLVVFVTREDQQVGYAPQPNLILLCVSCVFRII